MDKRKPDFRFEKRAWRQGYEVIIGVDEVGRGALAGPVVAGACAIFNSKFTIYNKFSNFKFQISNWESLGIDDSKRLTGKKREELAKVIRAGAVWGIGEANVATINRCGIVRATEKATRAAIAKVKSPSKNSKVFVLVDAFHVKYVPGVGLKNQKGIVKGDQKSLSIAAASIVAKVHRDKMMARIHRNNRNYKVYRWDKNKGYGTADHGAAIKKYGVTRLHRKKFVEKLL